MRIKIFKSKKAIVLGFLIKMVFAIVMIVTLAITLRSCFKLVDSEKDSFHSLSDLTENIKSGEYKASTLKIEKQTALLGFSKDSEKIELLTEIPKILNRPPECDSNKACLCLCKNFKPQHQELTCDESGYPLCKSFDTIDFPSELKGDVFAAEYSKSYNFKGGFIYSRAFYLPGSDIGVKSIFVERYSDLVSICFDYPCIIEEMKQKPASEETET